MFSVDDTIVAIATPAGRGAIGLVRISGPQAVRVAGNLIGRTEPLVPRHATFATTAVTPTHLRPSAAPASCPATSVPPRSLHLAAPPPPPGPPSLAHGTSAAVRDQVVVTFFPGPHSYTGDDVVEVSAHGSPVVLQSIVTAAMDAGARLAEPGEFTLRAFLNGKIDLVQAEAVADLINAVTPLQARAAFDQLEGTLTAAIGEIEATLFDLVARLEASLDFPDEGYHFVQREAAAGELRAIAQRIDRLVAGGSRGRLIREGAQVAIVGTPNVGKSSLFNALLNANRAIVTAMPGTTRDLLTERADIGGLSMVLVDTAGIRESDDVVEQEGVARARRAPRVADLTILVLDRSRALADDDHALIAATLARPRLIVINKVDLPAQWRPEAIGAPGAGAVAPGLGDAVQVSITAGVGLGDLVARMALALVSSVEDRDQPLVTNVRHLALLEHARAAVTRAMDSLDASDYQISEEFVLADLQDAATRLQEITGSRTTEDLLAHIFQNFCIGK